MTNLSGTFVLPELGELKLTKQKFMPRTMGAFILLIIILSFAAGAVRRELVLTLIGAVFSVVWVYCLVMTLLLALLHSRRAGRVSITVTPGELAAGDNAQVVYSENAGMARNNRLIQFPGILIRCRLLMETKDGRRIRHDFSPAEALSGGRALAGQTLEIKMRGAYFSGYDELAVFDILGFFRFTFHLRQKTGVRLLAAPSAAPQPLAANASSGESNRCPETTFQRTDILIEHRPYVPGDDPRRINWKLFSHGGELFIREGEREPPPHSNITILVDGQFDPMLYTIAAARDAVDLLCENALAAALACSGGGLNVQIGTNQAENSPVIQKTVTPAQMASALAWSAAVRLSTSDGHLPAITEDYGILILALPRASAGPFALDHFLAAHSGQGRTRRVEIAFLYSGNAHNDIAQAAENCAVMYNRRSGARARAAGV